MIRRLTIEDSAALDILRQSFQATPGDAWPDRTDAQWEAILRASEEGTGQFLLGLFSEETLIDSTTPLIGIVGLRREARLTVHHKASLWGLYIAPQARRKGIGTQLVEALLQEAQAMPGLEMIRLVVPTGNSPAITLFQKQGFQVYAVEPQARFRNGAYHEEAFLYRFLAHEVGGVVL